MSLLTISRFTSQNRESIKNAQLYIEAHCEQKISADQLSQDFLIPVKKLQRGIKIVTGYTIHNYLLKVRLDKAKDLLSNTDEPVQNIPARIGLTNLSHFSRIFKKHVGQTPVEYRLSQLAKCNS